MRGAAAMMTACLKSLLVAALIALAPAAEAASPEAAYFAARDAYVAKFRAFGDAQKIDDDALKQHDLAIAELGKLLQPVIGPVAIENFPAQARSNLDSLFEGDQGFGLLDALRYSSADDKTHIIVTTDAVLAHWLREHKDWWGPKVANVPQEMAAALQSEAFYTQALQTDAAISKYLELPVAKPTQAKFAFAMVVARAQDIGPRTPDELIVALVQGGRVFVVSAPANAKIAAMPACQKIWDEAQRKAAAIQQAYVDSELKNDKLSEQRERTEQEGDAAFHRCFAQRAISQGFFVGFTRQAQALIDRLPSR
jgi:hypothetical protein